MMSEQAKTRKLFFFETFDCDKRGETTCDGKRDNPSLSQKPFSCC